MRRYCVLQFKLGLSIHSKQVLVDQNESIKGKVKKVTLPGKGEQFIKLKESR